MDREKRRNSILKPFFHQQVLELEEEQTEKSTLVRRKSFKRVSFGQNEIKEFQKHEVLTVEKLEQALNKLHKDSSSDTMDLTLDEKENLRDDKNMFVDSSCSNFSQEMLTSCYSANETLKPCGNVKKIDSSPEIINPGSETESHPLLDEHQQERVEFPIDEGSKNNGKPIAMDTNEIVKEMNEADIHVVSTPSTATDVSMDKDVFQPHPILAEISKSSTEITPKPLDFSSDTCFQHLMQKFNWKLLKHRENEVLSFKKLYCCLSLKLYLHDEYISKNVRHFAIDDIDVDTKKDVPDKWGKFAYTVLENTLENSNLKSICSSTENLDKLFQAVENHMKTFLEFILEDANQFELITNPRSLKVDMDNSTIKFELSSLENVSWVKVSLSLNPLFPLCAKSVDIQIITGNVNVLELINMISTIRPSGHYLTRVAECVEDYLKFRPKNLDRKK